MNYTDIVAGMTGAQFIDAINGNNTKTENKFISVDADMLLRVLGNNIKQIRSNNGKLEFTLDGTNWVSVNNVVWGDIGGDIADQTDLNTALSAKANQSDLDITNGNVSSLTTNLGITDTNVSNNTRDIGTINTTIGTIQTKQAKQVSSDTIIQIRIDPNGFLQYTYDGISWTTIVAQAATAWGGISGTISNQTDLYNELSSKATQIALTNHENRHDNPHQVDKEQVGLGLVNNTSDAAKPISDLQQREFNFVWDAIHALESDKLDTSLDIQDIVYISLTDWQDLRDQGQLRNNVIYIVD